MSALCWRRGAASRRGWDARTPGATAAACRGRCAGCSAGRCAVRRLLPPPQQGRWTAPPAGSQAANGRPRRGTTPAAPPRRSLGCQGARQPRRCSTSQGRWSSRRSARLRQSPLGRERRGPNPPRACRCSACRAKERQPRRQCPPTPRRTLPACRKTQADAAAERWLAATTRPRDRCRLGRSCYVDQLSATSCSTGGLPVARLASRAGRGRGCSAGRATPRSPSGAARAAPRGHPPRRGEPRRHARPAAAQCSCTPSSCSSVAAGRRPPPGCDPAAPSAPRPRSTASRPTPRAGGRARRPLAEGKPRSCRGATRRPRS